MRRTSTTLAAFALALAIAACQASSQGPDTLGSQAGYGGTSPSPTTAPAGSNGAPPASNGGGGGGGGSASTGSGTSADAGSGSVLAQRAINYGEALRTATLKLVGDLPATADMDSLTSAAPGAQAMVYAGLISKLLADPRFAAVQIEWWRNTLKTGGPATTQGGPSFDTAATFAASVVVQDRPYTDLFTATTDTCPTYASGTFTAASCANGAPTAGILTDPGLMAQYYEDMAFRRVRFVQETFACSAFPAEYSASPVAMGAGIFTSPWNFDSIAGGPTAKINFQDTSAVICANCHTTINHIAPLFAYFDANGKYTAGAVQVMTPVTPPVTTTLTDWLPAGQPFAWRLGTTVTDLPSLGQAIAADPAAAACIVNRVWNWAFNHGDIVNDFATVPTDVTASYVQSFTTGGMKVKALIQSVFTSDDFVQF